MFHGGFAGGEHQDEKNNKLNGRERRQTVLSVKLGCSVAIIKGTEKDPVALCGRKEQINKIQCMVSSPQKKKCNDVGLGEEALFDLAQLLQRGEQNMTYLEKQRFLHTATICISRRSVC